jgi:hypothetical protein
MTVVFLFRIPQGIHWKSHSWVAEACDFLRAVGKQAFNGAKGHLDGPLGSLGPISGVRKIYRSAQTISASPRKAEEYPESRVSRGRYHCKTLNRTGKFSQIIKSKTQIIVKTSNPFPERYVGCHREGSCPFHIYFRERSCIKYLQLKPVKRRGHPPVLLTLALMVHGAQ